VRGLGCLLADFVAQKLLPVDLGACHWQLTAERLEGGVRHFHVVVTDSSYTKRFDTRSKILHLYTVLYRTILQECPLSCQHFWKSLAAFKRFKRHNISNAGKGEQKWRVG